MDTEKHPVVFFEIGGKDKMAISSFYKKVFGWVPGDDGLINSSGTTGIPGHIQSLGHEPHHYVMVYIQVDDIAEYMKKVEEAGGTAMVGPIELPDGRTFAWVSDIDGNLIGLLTQKPVD